MNVLSVGDAVYDILTPPLHRVGRAEKIADVIEIPGGNALNFSMEMASLGHDSALYTCLGNDDKGDKLLKWLKDGGVQFIGPRCGRTSITIGIQGDVKRFLTFTGCLESLNLKNVPLEGIDHLHVGGLWKLPIDDVLSIIARAKEAGVEVSVDISSPFPDSEPRVVHRILEQVDMLFLNEGEMQWLLDGKPFESVFRYLEKNLRYIVLHKGEKGGVVFSIDGYVEVHVPRVMPCLPVGAGDITNAAFVHAIHSGADVKTAANMAFCAGTLRVSGVRYPAENEIKTFMEMNKI